MRGFQVAPCVALFAGSLTRPPPYMAFPPRAHWSTETQGYIRTTAYERDTGSPGISTRKSTLCLGDGWKYDAAEAARIAARERAAEQNAPPISSRQRGRKSQIDQSLPPRVAASVPKSKQVTEKIMAQAATATAEAAKKVAEEQSAKPSNVTARLTDDQAKSARSSTTRRQPSPRTLSTPRAIAGRRLVQKVARWDSETQGYTGSDRFVHVTVAELAALEEEESDQLIAEAAAFAADGQRRVPPIR